jgi:hypothetical protein
MQMRITVLQPSHNMEYGFQVFLLTQITYGEEHLCMRWELRPEAASIATSLKALLVNAGVEKADLSAWHSGINEQVCRIVADGNKVVNALKDASNSCTGVPGV